MLLGRRGRWKTQSLGVFKDERDGCNFFFGRGGFALRVFQARPGRDSGSDWEKKIGDKSKKTVVRTFSKVPRKRSHVRQENSFGPRRPPDE